MEDVEAEADLTGTLRRLFALERDVLVLSVAMFAFSLGVQMTSRYMPEYLSLLGAGSVAVGLYGSLSNLVSAVYPYPGGALADRVGPRTALTAFGLASTVGFLVWLAAPLLPTVVLAPVSLGTVALAGSEIGPLGVGEVVLPLGVFAGLLLVQAWKSLGLGATFAVVKQAVEPGQLATGFASTETVRRLAFLLGPLLAAGVLAVTAFDVGFRILLAIAAVVALVATVVQHALYEPESPPGKSFEGIGNVVADLRAMPDELVPLLLGDTLVRFANGMVYVFFVLVVTTFLRVDVTLPVVGYLNPPAFFGVLLAVEMAVALATMVPVSRVADRVGRKPVVALGFLVYAVFPAVLISVPDAVAVLPPTLLGVPADAVAVTVAFAFSGLRFAGLPAHKALIVGPAERHAGGRVTGSYYLVRNTVVIPSAVVGGLLYDAAPETAFYAATAVGLVGVALFLVFGEEFEV